MNKYIQAILEYFKSKSYYIYEDPQTGEVFTYRRKGIYKKDGRILIFRKSVGTDNSQGEKS